MDPLEKNLVSTITQTEIGNLADIGDVGFQALLEDGSPLRDIPIFGGVIKAGGVVGSIRDFFFYRKMVGVLQEISDVSLDVRRRRFNEELGPDDQERIASSIVLYIDRLDSMEKPELFGKALRSFLLGDINQNQFLYFANFIDKVFILDWQSFTKAVADLATDLSGQTSRVFKGVHQDDALNLESVGMYRHVNISPVAEQPRRPQAPPKIHTASWLEPTDSGWSFVQNVLGFFRKDDDKSKQARSALRVEIKSKRH